MAEEKYPELDKIAKNKEESQSIGAFLDWLQTDKKIIFCKWDEKVSQHHPTPDYTSIEKLLAEYFGVDLKKAEKERQEILASLKTT